ncbi:hypothetical protein BK816_01635 [Boudabousia tangfeifanii]|uniref:Uncharacterized protein n=1 Tax=Boudabousia tangfeifanii TaxID=1912795 RepID=A0A1D9MIX4_9ACTO|nr:hypothetical protein [Boudabousia tangfeifanii]AOZ72158.1 hypothetical protein BK816_01635 [Boudabousia tangfeifanii]
MFKKLLPSLMMLLFALLMGYLSVGAVISDPVPWRIALHLIGTVGLATLSGAFMMAAVAGKAGSGK